MKDTVQVTKKRHDFFFDFLGFIWCFGINIRIEVHFFWFALGNERTLDCMEYTMHIVYFVATEDMIITKRHQVYDIRYLATFPTIAVTK